MPVTDGSALFKITLTAQEATKFRNVTGSDAQAVRAALDDPEIAFVPNSDVLLVGLDYRTFASKHMEVRKYIRMKDISEAMLSATDLFKRTIKKGIDDSREDCRKTFDPSTFKEPPQPRIDPTDSGKSSAKKILDSSPGGYIWGKVPS